MMLVKLFPAGMLGLGLTALLASFMSGMAGNVTAFNTVWTYDIYQSHIKPGATDEHYLWMGRVATVGGILLSIAAAYVAGSFNNIMDLLQLVFAFVNAPLFATFLLGMFWKRSTGHGAFLGLLSGTHRRRGAPRADAADGCDARREGRLLRPDAHLPERAGADVLDGDRRVDDLLRRDHRRQPRDEAAPRVGAERGSSTRSRRSRRTAICPGSSARRRWR